MIPIASADDVPLIPDRFYGSVTVNGETAPDGTIVSAWVNDVEIMRQATIDGKYGYVPPASDEFQVSGEDGIEITFKIYDTVAEIVILDIGDDPRLDISATGVTIPSDGSDDSSSSRSSSSSSSSRSRPIVTPTEEANETVIVIATETTIDTPTEVVIATETEIATPTETESSGLPITVGTLVTAVGIAYLVRRNE